MQGFPKIIDCGMFFIKDYKQGTPRYRIDEKLKLHGFYLMPKYPMSLNDFEKTVKNNPSTTFDIFV
jgi:hypothetical protein